MVGPQFHTFPSVCACVQMRIKRNNETSRGWFDDELTKQKMDWKEGLDLGKSNGQWEGEHRIHTCTQDT